MIFLIVLQAASIAVSGQITSDQRFDWISGNHIREQNDFAVSPDFTIDVPESQFEVTSLEVGCAMRNLATTGAAVWDVGAMVGDQSARWSKPPPTDIEKAAMNYKGVAFGQVGPGWSGQPIFSLDYLSKVPIVAGAPVYNENWIRFYGNTFRPTTGKVHVSIVVWSGLGAQMDLVVDSCYVRLLFKVATGVQTCGPVNADVYSLPACAVGPDGNLVSRAFLTSISGPQIATVRPRQTLSFIFGYQIWQGSLVSEIDQLLVVASWSPSWPPPPGYYWGIYTGVPPTYPGSGGFTTVSLSAPSASGSYYLWFGFAVDYGYDQAAKGFGRRLSAPPAHVKIEVSTNVPDSTVVTVTRITGTGTSFVDIFAIAGSIATIIGTIVTVMRLTKSRRKRTKRRAKATQK